MRARSRREKLVALARQAGFSTEQPLPGESPGWRLVDVEPKPKRQPKLLVRPDAVIEAEMARDMERVWQTHEATSTWSTYRALWPNAADFRRNWPGLAFDLIVADWKVRRAFSALEIEEIPAEILNPRPPEREPWQLRYLDELADYPAIGWALEQSLDAVFRRAKLTPTYSIALRGWLQGESDKEVAKQIGRQPKAIPAIRTKALAAVITAFRISSNVIGPESNPFVHVGGEASCSQSPTSTPFPGRLSSARLAG